MTPKANGRLTTSPPGAGSRRTIATFASYGEAERAVDYLSDQRFPVERVAIVGSGLRWVEQVTGRLDFVRAALDGALSGGFAGVLFGFVLGIFVVDDTDAIALLFLGLVFGVVFGAIWGLLAHWASGGRRDFTSVPGIVADRYDVIVDTEVADEAERLLAARTSSRD
jgi:hypothetical protein